MRPCFHVFPKCINFFFLSLNLKLFQNSTRSFPTRTAPLAGSLQQKLLESKTKITLVTCTENKIAF